MAVSNIIRRASQVVPYAVRIIGGTPVYQQRSYALLTTVASRNFYRSSVQYMVRCYSTKRPSPDEALLKAIQSEIECDEESDEQDEVEEAPEGFPFEIEDHPGQQTITLTRLYQGETISVEVHMPDPVTGDEDNENDDNDDSDEDNENDDSERATQSQIPVVVDSERATQSQIPLVVSVYKKNGPSLEFGCTAFADEIAIDTLSIKDINVAEDQIAYEGPDFTDLDENLQKAFHTYLEVRGIKPITTNFLHEYMINKEGREYITWLKKVKKFIEA